jgi:hypothetical protein
MSILDRGRRRQEQRNGDTKSALGRALAKRALGFACMLTLTSSVAIAATLTTPPFPGLNVSSGTALCTATNLGTSDTVVTFELFNDYGDLLSSSVDFPLPPGRTYAPVGANLANTTPTFCRFTTRGKISASFNHIGSGGSVLVIPASK